jgi:hypothetical protein
LGSCRLPRASETSQIEMVLEAWLKQDECAFVPTTRFDVDGQRIFFFDFDIF